MGKNTHKIKNSTQYSWILFFYSSNLRNISISDYLNANCTVGVKKVICVSHGFLHSEHHAVQTIFHELFVKSHELGDESFQVVDGFVAHL